jgi:hypothetical protein
MMRPRPDGVPAVVIQGEAYMARLHDRLRHRLPLWVIYRPVTREYPGLWVTRMHVVLPEIRATRFVMTHDTLEQLRSILPPGLARLARDPNDEPEIEEVWA